MFSTLFVVLPIFALIFAGWLVQRIGVLGPQSTTELNRFVVYLALPALLFDIIAHTRGAEIWQPGFIGAFGLSSAIVFVFIFGIRWSGRRMIADAAIDALNAGYANTGFIGFPLVLVALGQQALAPTVVATIITVCALFAVAIVLIEFGLQAEKRPVVLVRKVCGSLIRNPLLVAPVLGALVPLTGVQIPAPIETFLKLLGGAASPCALVALGLFLAKKSETAHAGHGTSTLLVGFKLIVQPALAWLLASFVFQLSPLLTHTAVLLAALPTGTGPFMLAEFYRREAAMTSRVILVSTIVSIFTVSGYLYWAI